MSVAKLLFKDLIKDLKKEQRGIERKIKILRSWTGEAVTKKSVLKNSRAHSLRMKRVWREKRKLMDKVKGNK